uniref:Ras and Rab interactor 2 n=1 Tax=Loxodonta africana TaxID=9785 RepID=G3TTH9_LOXAF
IPRRRLSILDRLLHTHPIWLQLSLSEEEAAQVLRSQPPGIFLVRKSIKMQKKVLALRLPCEFGVPLKEFAIKESTYTFSLEGSGISFADLFRLIAFYCISRIRDVLPFTLKLPYAISTAKTEARLEELAQLGLIIVQPTLKQTGASFAWVSPKSPHLLSLLSLGYTQTRSPDVLFVASCWGKAVPDRKPCGAPPVPVLGSQATSLPWDGPSLQPPGHLPPPPAPLLMPLNPSPFWHEPHLPPHSPWPVEGREGMTQGRPHKTGDMHSNTRPCLEHRQALLRRLVDLGRMGGKPSRMSKTPYKLCNIPHPPGPAAGPVPTLLGPPQKVHSQDLSGSLPRSSTRTPSVNGTTRPRSPPPRPPPPTINSLHTSSQLSRSETQASMPETANHSKHGNVAVPGTKPTPVPPPRLKKQASFLEAESSAKTLTGRPGPGLQPELGTAGGPGGTPPSEAPGDCTRAQPPGSESRPPWNGGRQRLSDEADTNSSLEDYDGESDQETMPPPIKSKKRSSSFVLPKIVKSQLRKMSGVFSSFMTPEKRMVRRIAELSRDKRTYFGCLVQDYVSFLQENKECHVSSTDLLQTIRQFMTQVKNYLSQSSELDPPIESLIPEDQIDVVLEKAMHKCILKPLKGHVEAMLKDFHVADGSWRQLKDNLQLVRQRNPQELGVFAPTPDFVDVEKIKVKFMTMQKMYSPEKKVMLLLRVCKLIYTVMGNNSVPGRMYGADDFLPVLTYVIAQCDMLELDTEIEYMMELLDPSLLHGEGGYYLTSAYGALSLIKNFQEEQAAQLLSSETRDTLRQWHKRRTTNRTIPSVDDFQNYLRVAFQEVNSGCTGKTLLVRPYVTTEDVCQLCAEKFKVGDPEEYSLFLFVDETWQQLAEDTYPQKIKAELHSRPQPHVFHFVYK